MPQSPHLFVDSHCHLFNLVDIPLYETLDGKVAMNTVFKLLAAFSPTLALIGIGKAKLHENKEFVQFFERPQDENMKALARQIKETTTAKRIVMTPLVMDFDCIRQPQCGPQCNPCTGRICPQPQGMASGTASDPTAEGQYWRLKHAVNTLNGRNDMIEGNVKVLPFLGFDLRKLTPKNHNGLTGLQSLWKTARKNAITNTTGFAGIKNGTPVGIKLYPPIGFNPWPRGKPKVLTKYRDFYDWCVAENIPLTVHCQSGSYSAARKQSEVNADTHAGNWLRLFEAYGNDFALRINFAHFGGEDGLEDMLDWWRPNGIQKGTWTYCLMKLLKTYKNTYADISAFDWADSRAVKNLAILLEKDITGKLPSELKDLPYSLSDKLLWGSDVPMTVSDKSYRHLGKTTGQSRYKFLFQHFTAGLAKCNVITPPQLSQLVTKMTDTNPSAFLL